MKQNPISIFAINASVVSDVTPKGKFKFIINLNSDAGTAVDRVQFCHDFRLQNLPSFELIEGENIFKKGDCYITFSMVPKSNESINLITCRCEHPELSQNEAVELVKKGMEMAFNKLNS
jgi:hypothetical protein